MTSICRPSAMALQGSHTPQGSMVGPPCPSGPTQFSALAIRRAVEVLPRSEEHTSELQSLMRISYAVFCLKKKNTITYMIAILTRHDPRDDRYTNELNHN